MRIHARTDPLREPPTGPSARDANLDSGADVRAGGGTDSTGRGGSASRTGSAALGPDSLTWKYLGDIRGTLLVQRAGVLQVMHPAIAAALIDHSDVFANPLARLMRSAGPILGVVYDEDPEATARWVRDQHPRIRGHEVSGRRYHALDPDTYYWAHATFFEAQIATQELFGTPLTYTAKEQLYAESVTWYARYGLTMRPVPRDYAAFERYWQSMFDDVLQPTKLALAAVRTTRELPAPSPAIDGPLWTAVQPFIRRGAPWLARGTLPAQAREILSVSWSRQDELALGGLRTLIQTAWPVVPARLRLLPLASRRTRSGETRGDRASRCASLEAGHAASGEVGARPPAGAQAHPVPDERGPLP